MLALVLMLGACSLGFCKGHNQDADARGHLRLVATVPVARARAEAQAIAVDQDGRILLVEMKHRSAGKIIQRFDYEANIPKDFTLLDRIPKNQVITTIRKLTDTRGKWKVWFVLALGFPPESAPRGAGPADFVYVFREDRDKGDKLLSQYSGIVTAFVVDDINGDGFDEFAVQYMDQVATSPSTWLKIWQVSRNGSLNEISLDEVMKGLDLKFAPKSVLELGDYRNGDDTLYSEQTTDANGGWLTVRKTYGWNPIASRYQLKETVKTEERILQ